MGINNDDKSRVLLKALLILIAGAILLTGWILSGYLRGYIEDRGKYDIIRNTAYGSDNGAGSKDTSTNEEILIDFDALKKINPDTAGWLIAAGGEIDGPVVQASDDEYYLDHRFDGSKSSAGTFFADMASAPAFKTPCTVVYGHNRKDGSMFHPLLKYKDRDFFETHPYFTVITEDGEKEYRIVSAFYSDYYDIPGVGDGETDPGEIFENAVNRSLYDTGEDSTGFDPGKDRLVILCTCEYSGKENRMVVYGVMSF